MTDAMSIAMSGLRANKTRLNTAAENIANISTTGRTSGSPAPYAPKDTVSAMGKGGGVSTDVVTRQDGVSERYAPQSPFADGKGLIGQPDISLETEIVDMKTAELAYKANISVMKTAEDMQDEFFDTLK